MTPTANGLIAAFLLNGKGGGKPLDWAGVRRWKPRQGLLWVHLDRTHPQANQWLEEESGANSVVVESLVSNETRPRLARMQEGLLLNLRGLNFNPGSDPEDMVSLRIWARPGRILTAQRTDLLTIRDLIKSLETGDGPRNEGDFLVFVSDRLTDRMNPFVDDLEEAVDNLEEALPDTDENQLHAELAEVRRKVIALRRYLAPQALVMEALAQLHTPWISQLHHEQLADLSNHTTRLVEELTAARERAGVLQDEFQGRLTFRLNRTIYLLTIVSTVLLPLSVITGLLGINVAGIPGSGEPWAFAAVVGLLAVMALGEVALLRFLKWI
ncbi:MAG: zinc transporter ZntB [Deltaproteobacteria bacterium]|nr:zinc transporter ZntB [Deltaproteobacteria bacterium]